MVSFLYFFFFSIGLFNPTCAWLPSPLKSSGQNSLERSDAAAFHNLFILTFGQKVIDGRVLTLAAMPTC